MADLREVKRLAWELYKEHNLKDWWFSFDNAKSRFGVCYYENKHISLSRELTLLNSMNEVRETLLHEIAHALVGYKHGHDDVWKAKCIELGIAPERCYDNKRVKTPEGKFKYKCPKCDKIFDFHRRLRIDRACPNCCDKYSYGYYDEKFKLERFKDGEKN